MARSDDREERLAAQLRQNLRRRKAQTRSAAEREAGGTEGENQRREPEGSRGPMPPKDGGGDKGEA